MAELIRLRIATTAPRHDEPFGRAYWDAAGLSPSSNPSLKFISFLPSGDSLVRGALLANGISPLEQADKTLLVVCDYLDPAIQQIAQSSTEWLLAKPVGHTLWFGPIFKLGETVCWDCLTYWLRVNRWLLSAYNDGEAFQPSRAMLPSTFMTAIGHLATVTSLWLAKGSYPQLHNCIHTFDTRSFAWHTHTVRPAPGCTACVADKPELHDLVSPISGMVSDLATSADSTAGYWFARASAIPPLAVSKARPPLRPIPISGRGGSRLQAEQSCMGEAVERYSAIFQGNEVRRVALIEELGEAAILPSTLFQFSEAQYANRVELNLTLSDEHSIPEPVNLRAPLEWTKVHALASGELKYVPSAYCYLWYQTPLHAPIYWADTNGCAAGPTLSEAVLSGLLELIERDAIAIWWDNRLKPLSWSIEDFPGGNNLRDARDCFLKQGRSLQLLNVTTDIGIPVCVAVAANVDGSQPFFAASAAVDCLTAAHRAVGELAGILHSQRSKAPYFEWIRKIHLRDQPHLAAGQPSRAVESSTGLQQQLAYCVEALRHVGLEPYLLDLTRPEIKVPVVRVIVPGLRHHWGRQAPGRLYDVPVRLGLRSRPTPESELNPTSCML